jgi:hypothetical protein
VLSNFKEPGRSQTASLSKVPQEVTVVVLHVVKKGLQEGVASSSEEAAHLAKATDMTLSTRLAADQVGQAHRRRQSGFSHKR